MPGNKDDRLQLRMEPELKDWFKDDAAPEGGMSRVVHQHVAARYEKKTGKPWKGSTSDGTTKTDPGDGGAADLAEHGAGTD
jgi:hypothetical protein